MIVNNLLRYLSIVGQISQYFFKNMVDRCIPLCYDEVDTSKLQEGVKMAKHIVLSDGEWKLMKLLWENHPMTLGDMVEAMQDDTAWSKGTIFTMLRRMSTKGVIRMDDSGKYQQYYPVLQKEEAEQAETRSFLERVYDGSVGMMLSAMAHECKLSKSEIDELYEIIREAREEEK